MNSPYLSIHIFAILLVVGSTVSFASGAEDQTERADTEQSKAAVIEAIGKRFSLIDTSVRYEPVFRNRYWLVTIEAHQVGAFALRVDFQQRLLKQNRVRDEQYMFPFTVAKRGTAREIVRSPGHVHYPVLACVGDRIVVPVRMNDRDMNHRFTLTKVAADEAQPAQQGKAAKLPFDLKNAAAAELLPVAGAVETFSNASRTAFYHGLGGVFDVAQAGKMNVRAYPGPVRPANRNDLVFCLEVVEETQSITVMMPHWHLYWFEDGERSARGNMGFHQRVSQVRVGDRIALRTSTYTTSAENKTGKPYPAMIVEKTPFDRSPQRLQKSLPKRQED